MKDDLPVASVISQEALGGLPAPAPCTAPSLEQGNIGMQCELPAVTVASLTAPGIVREPTPCVSPTLEVDDPMIQTACVVRDEATATPLDVKSVGSADGPDSIAIAIAQKEGDGNDIIERVLPVFTPDRQDVVVGELVDSKRSENAIGNKSDEADVALLALVVADAADNSWQGQVATLHAGETCE